jgi:hypothetical protein
MRIRMTDPTALDDLISFLQAELAATIEQVADDELEVSILGSLNADALRMQLYLRIRAWEAAHRGTGVHVELET